MCHVRARRSADSRICGGDGGVAVSFVATVVIAILIHQLKYAQRLRGRRGVGRSDAPLHHNLRGVGVARASKQHEPHRRVGHRNRVTDLPSNGELPDLRRREIDLKKHK